MILQRVRLVLHAPAIGTRPTAFITTSSPSPSSSPTEGAKLTQLPSEILRNIFRSLFEEVIIDLKTPHELTQQKLIALFPIIAVDERLSF